MQSSTRQEQILAYLKQHSQCGVKELAAALYVSDATIRRDLSEMQQLGLLKRNHGGALLLERADETSIFIRMAENAKEKERAATRILPHLPSFQTVFMDSSSTVLALAQRMELKGKTVVTNGLQTMQSLARARDVNIIMPGGSLSPTGTSIVGSWTNKMLSEFHFDLMLTSCAAIIGRDVYETSLEQREVKRTVFERSDYKILIADHGKLTKTGTYRFAALEDFQTVAFDRLTEEERERFSDLPVLS